MLPKVHTLSIKAGFIPFKTALVTYFLKPEDIKMIQVVEGSNEVRVHTEKYEIASSYTLEELLTRIIHAKG